ncbi:MAG: thermonuclease family protein [Candidatus Diapherotrites archaeon]|nr:thermonuclease family protein [Candidatus Diapherotrites archaeon]
MKKRRSERLFLLLASILLLAAFAWFSVYVCPFCLSTPSAGPAPSNPNVVAKVIDGDTIELASGEKVRMLGINTPEKTEPYYAQAKERGIGLMQYKTVRLEAGTEDKDQYGRLLRYVFVDGVNINEIMIREGLASTYFFSEKTPYYAQLRAAQKEAQREGKGIWAPSRWPEKNCLELKELNPFGDDEFVEFQNDCPQTLALNGIYFKDAGRKTYTFTEMEMESGKSVRVYSKPGMDSKTVLYWNQPQHIWNDEGDQLMVRDANGGLILYYGYPMD